MFILPYLAAAVALYLASKLIRRMLRKKTVDGEKMPTRPAAPPPAKPGSLEEHLQKADLIEQLREDLVKGKIPFTFASSSSKGMCRLPERYEPIGGMWNSIFKIVNEISFFEKQMTIRHKIGEEAIPSPIPSDDFAIVPMQHTGQFPKVINSHMGLDDDLFYSKIASNQIHIKQDLELVGVYEDKTKRIQRFGRILQDVSGSEKGQRIAWSRVIDTLLAEKAKRSRANITLTTFTQGPVSSISASFTEPISYAYMNSFIEQNLQADGGTDISAALLHDLAIIEKDNEGLDYNQDVQIILITDGTEGINEDLILEKLKKNQVTLHTVILGVSHDQLRNVSSKFHFLDIPGIA
jgi:uncharacterized protein YegL